LRVLGVDYAGRSAGVENRTDGDYMAGCAKASALCPIASVIAVVGVDESGLSFKRIGTLADARRRAKKLQRARRLLPAVSCRVF